MLLEKTQTDLLFACTKIIQTDEEMAELKRTFNEHAGTRSSVPANEANDCVSAVFKTFNIYADPASSTDGDVLTVDGLRDIVKDARKAELNVLLYNMLGPKAAQVGLLGKRPWKLAELFVSKPNTLQTLRGVHLRAQQALDRIAKLLKCCETEWAAWAQEKAPSTMTSTEPVFVNAEAIKVLGGLDDAPDEMFDGATLRDLRAAVGKTQLPLESDAVLRLTRSICTLLTRCDDTEIAEYLDPTRTYAGHADCWPLHWLERAHIWPAQYLDELQWTFNDHAGTRSSVPANEANNCLSAVFRMLNIYADPALSTDGNDLTFGGLRDIVKDALKTHKRVPSAFVAGESMEIDSTKTVADDVRRQVVKFMREKYKFRTLRIIARLNRFLPVEETDDRSASVLTRRRFFNSESGGIRWHVTGLLERIPARMNNKDHALGCVANWGVSLLPGVQPLLPKVRFRPPARSADATNSKLWGHKDFGIKVGKAGQIDLTDGGAAVTKFPPGWDGSVQRKEEELQLKMRVIGIGNSGKSIRTMSPATADSLLSGQEEVVLDVAPAANPASLRVSLAGPDAELKKLCWGANAKPLTITVPDQIKEVLASFSLTEGDGDRMFNRAKAMLTDAYGGAAPQGEGDKGRRAVDVVDVDQDLATGQVFVQFSEVAFDRFQRHTQASNEETAANAAVQAAFLAASGLSRDIIEDIAGSASPDGGYLVTIDLTSAPAVHTCTISAAFAHDGAAVRSYSSSRVSTVPIAPPFWWVLLQEKLDRKLDTAKLDRASIKAALTMCDINVRGGIGEDADYKTLKAQLKPAQPSDFDRNKQWLSEYLEHLQTPEAAVPTQRCHRVGGPLSKAPGASAVIFGTTDNKPHQSQVMPWLRHGTTHTPIDAWLAEEARKSRKTPRKNGGWCVKRNELDHTVVDVHPGGLAAGKLKPDDHLLAINGIDIDDMTRDEVLSLISKATDLQIRLERVALPNVQVFGQFDITRATLQESFGFELGDDVIGGFAVPQDILKLQPGQRATGYGRSVGGTASVPLLGGREGIPPMTIHFGVVAGTVRPDKLRVCDWSSGYTAGDVLNIKNPTPGAADATVIHTPLADHVRAFALCIVSHFVKRQCLDTDLGLNNPDSRKGFGSISGLVYNAPPVKKMTRMKQKVAEYNAEARDAILLARRALAYEAERLKAAEDYGGSRAFGDPVRQSMEESRELMRRTVSSMAKKVEDLEGLCSKRHLAGTFLPPSCHLLTTFLPPSCHLACLSHGVLLRDVYSCTRCRG